MKNIWRIFTTVLVLLLAGFLGYQVARFYPPGNLSSSPDTTYISKVVPGDIRLVEIEVPVPQPVYIETSRTKIVEVPADVDTAAILEDYFRVRKYDSIIKKDSNFRARYQLMIARNRLQSFKFEHQNLRQKEVNETHIYKYNTGFFGGVSVMLAPQHMNIGPSLMYLNGKDAFTASVGLLQKEYRLTYTRKISLRPP